MPGRPPCLTCANAFRWDEQNALLVESHERVIAELAEEAEAKLAEEVLAAEGLRQEKETLEKEAVEVSNKHQGVCSQHVWLCIP